MRVVSVIPFLDSRGGTEGQFRSIVPLLAARGVRMRIVTCAYVGEVLRRRSSSTGEPLHHRIVGVPVSRVPLPRLFGGTAVNGAFFVGGTAAVATSLAPSADVLAGYGLGAIPAAIAARATGRALVVRMVNDWHIGWIRSLLGGRLFSRLILGADRIVSVSAATRDYVAGEGADPTRLRVIPNGIDADRFRPLRDETERRTLRHDLHLPDRPCVVFVGRLDPHKAPDALFEAWLRVGERTGSLRPVLIILGKPADGADRARLDRWLARFPRGAVQWRGSVGNVPDYLRVADLFVFPSLREGLPNALLEASAVGVGIVATSIPSNVEALGGGADPDSALLVPPSDAGALADAIVALLEDPDRRRRLGRAAHDHVLATYSLASAADSTVALFREVLAERAAVTG